MNDKLKRLAHKMLIYIPDSETTIQEIYNRLVHLASTQKEYFQYLGPSSIIKLTIYVYCLMNFKDLKIADKYLNNLLFAKIFIHDGENYLESCDECGGSGYLNCSDCDGSGEVSCGQCDGNGKETCPDCGGDGEIDGEVCDNCDGKKEVDCDDCDGSGETTCYECNGDGSYNCNECDGNGEIESGEQNYIIETICTWDNTLKSILTTSEGKLKPAISEDKLHRYSDKMIYLNSEERHDELSDFVQENTDEYFCIITSDEPRLLFVHSMKVFWDGGYGYTRIMDRYIS